MRNFLDLCKARHSVRTFGRGQVKQEDLDYIMECVRRAPSAVNLQPWRFLLVRKEERDLIRRCYTRDWFAFAPTYVIACYDKDKAWVRRQDGKCHGDIDAAIAIEHFCLAAADRGLGCCWVCNFDVALCRELFHLPENIIPVALLPLGYEDEKIPPKHHDRMSAEELWLKR